MTFSGDQPKGQASDRLEGRSKDWWRSEMKRRLKEVTSDVTGGVEKVTLIDDANSRIGTVVSEITSSRSGLWLAFSSTRQEPLLPAITGSAGTRYAFPRMVADTASQVAAAKMKFYVWNEPATAAVWNEHRFGIREPDVNHPAWSEVSESELSQVVRGALIPGLGFDRRLRRLGRGAGFYDRFLKDSAFLKVGVGFAVQMTDELPHESHDIELDAVVTDRELIWRMTSRSVPRARKVDVS